jgi:hypothetical protein
VLEEGEDELELVEDVEEGDLEDEPDEARRRTGSGEVQPCARAREPRARGGARPEDMTAVRAAAVAAVAAAGEAGSG